MAHALGSQSFTGQLLTAKCPLGLAHGCPWKKPIMNQTNTVFIFRRHTLVLFFLWAI